MPPKKKGSKRQEEDWEADLGEAAPSSAPAESAPDNDGEDNEEGGEDGGGGLLAALRKNKNKKAKKGKPVNDFVEGEDAADANGDSDLAAKAPEEGTMDDEDVFAGKKAAKGKGAAAAKPVSKEAEEGEMRVKSKKEKEKEKKEREKQRKKEQVCFLLILRFCVLAFADDV